MISRRVNFWAADFGRRAELVGRGASCLAVLYETILPPLEIVMTSLFVACLCFFALAAALLFFGLVFGLVVIPTINERLGLICILLPFLVWPVCLYYYSKTRYASRLILGGLAAGAVAIGLAMTLPGGLAGLLS